MSNALSEEKKQQVIALGKLGWSLRKIERETGVRRETAGAYLKAVGIAVRIPRAWGRRAPAKPVDEVTPDLVDSKPAISNNVGRVKLFLQASVFFLFARFFSFCVCPVFFTENFAPGSPRSDDLQPGRPTASPLSNTSPSTQRGASLPSLKVCQSHPKARP
jgi:hypothetical protein